MRTSVWYRTEAKNPDKSGYYLSYRGFGMGGMSDYDHANGYMYYDKKSDAWYDYDDGRDSAIVYYWTTADPEQWVEDDPPSIRIRKGYNPVTRSYDGVHPAVEDAWREVEEAIKRYETVRALCQK
jgi:hypothetical protein